MIGRPGAGYGTITGQGNGQGGREHGQRCNQLPGGRDITNPSHRKHIADFWGIQEEQLPGEGFDGMRDPERNRVREIKGLLSISFNPLVSIPDSARTRKALEKLEFYVAIDFFLNETARFADVFTGLVAGGRRRDSYNRGGDAFGRNSVSPPGNARLDWVIIKDLAANLGAGDYFEYNNAGEIFKELTAASRGGNIDYSGMSYERIEKENGIFWPCPDKEHPELLAYLKEGNSSIRMGKLNSMPFLTGRQMKM